MTRAKLGALGHLDIDHTVLEPPPYAVLEHRRFCGNGVSARNTGSASASARREEWVEKSPASFTHREGFRLHGSQRRVFPTIRIAIAVLTATLMRRASSHLVGRSRPRCFFALAMRIRPCARAGAKAIFEGLQHCRIARSLLTSNTPALFSRRRSRFSRAGFGPLGNPEGFEAGRAVACGRSQYMTFRQFRIVFPEKKNALHLTTFRCPDGKLEQYQIVG